MKYLLVAINAKYIHSNLGVYSLRSYAKQKCPSVTVEIGEYTINHRLEDILKDIYKRKPDVVAFSCYIWNINYVKELICDLHKVMPDTPIWLGGPEVSYDYESLFQQYQMVRGVMIGEGEETFSKLIHAYEGELVEHALQMIPGVVYRNMEGDIVVHEEGELLSMDEIPFSYQDLSEFQNRIIYYESSRGCPFSCSYCMSALDKTVRFRSFSLVEKELAFFLRNQVMQVKFIDRTFNCKKSHAMAIWQYLLDHDNGVTNFHFEVSADLLDDDVLELMKQMRPGLIQLEIGVQSTYEPTIQAIKRRTDLKRLKQVVQTIRKGHNIHQHLDLIAGLPYEDYDQFQTSFNDVFEMGPDQLQLGFLKVLKGSYMAEEEREYQLQFISRSPYEILSTKWLGYEEVLRLKGVEEMVEVYYNSGQFTNTIHRLVKEFETPFSLFEQLANCYETRGWNGYNHNRITRYEHLYEFVNQVIREEEIQKEFTRLLMCDLYLREKVKSRPSFATDQTPYKAFIKSFFIEEEQNPIYLTGYEGYQARQMANMAHLEVFSEKEAMLFDYRQRDPLNHNAKYWMILR